MHLCAVQRMRKAVRLLIGQAGLLMERGSGTPSPSMHLGIVQRMRKAVRLLIGCNHNFRSQRTPRRRFHGDSRGLASGPKPAALFWGEIAVFRGNPPPSAPPSNKSGPPRCPPQITPSI